MARTKTVLRTVFRESVDAGMAGGVDPKAISLYPTDSTYSLYAIEKQGIIRYPAFLLPYSVE